MSETIRVLKAEPGKAPETTECPIELHDLQREVGGYIEVIYPFDDDVRIIRNEEDFGSLSDGMLEKYGNMFRTSEMFAQLGGKISVMPMHEK